MSEKHDWSYKDSFPTCVETFTTLRIFSGNLAPEEISKTLRIRPTSAFRKGESHCFGRLRRKANGWFYTTEKLSKSRDCRRHVDLILAALHGKNRFIRSLQAKGCKMDITGYFLSVGQGGPWLMPDQMLKLGKLNLSIWWDVYFSPEDER